MMKPRQSLFLISITLSSLSLSVLSSSLRGIEVIPDLSCFTQMWNSEDPAHECQTVHDRSGKLCVWCAGSAAMFSQTGACVSESQVQFIDGSIVSCSTKIDSSLSPI